jgi:two-component system cell cycle sensor histidine kinase/response regulator CckA
MGSPSPAPQPGPTSGADAHAPVRLRALPDPGADDAPTVVLRFGRDLRAVTEGGGAVPPALLEAWTREAERVFRTGREAVAEAEVETAGGTRVHRGRGIPVRGADGAVESVLYVATDVTALRAARASEAAGAELMQATLDALPAHVAVLDETGTITAVNAPWARFARANGADPAAVGVGVDYLAACTAAEGESGRDALAVARAIRRLAAGHDDAFAVEYPCPASGEERWFSLRLCRFVAGGRARVLAVHEDITARRRAEEEQRASEERYRSIFARSLDAILVMVPGGEIVAANPAACEMLGLDEAEIRARGRRGVTDGDDPRLHRLIAERGRTGRARGEVRMVRGDGASFEAEVSTATYQDGAGRERVIVIARDASERMTAEARVRASEARLRAIFDSAAIAITLTDLDGRIERANPAAERLYGYPRAELTTLRVPELDEGPEWEAERPLFAALARGERESYGMDRRFRRRDGTHAWGHLTASLIRDADGAPLLVARMVEDVTPRHRAEEALRASEAQFRALVENLPDVVTRNDPEGRFLYVSPAADPYLTFPSDELLGRRLQDSPLAGPAADAWDAAVRQVAATGTPVEHEMAYPAPDGQLRHFVWCIVPETDRDGAVRTVLCRGGDITARRRMEAELRQSQKMEAVGRLAGGVAHDFNNVLTVVRGTAELALAELRPGDPLRGDLEEILRAAARAGGLTAQLLAFSRRQVLQPQVLDLDARLRAMESMLPRLIGEDVALTLRLASAPARVRVDPGQFEQVVMNLVVNARDAMPDGGQVTIETSVVEVPPGAGDGDGPVPAGAYVEVAVTDTGTGIDAAALPRIFEPFFTTKPAGHGTGLGLATVYGIVKQSGGTVQVATRPGRGTTFAVRLPALAAPVAAAEPAHGDAPAAVPFAAAAATVLVVEDEDAVRVLCARILSGAGYRVLVARDATEALALARGVPRPLDVLLTDVILPGMSGPALAEEVRALHPGLRVLFMSGYTDDRLQRVALDPATVRLVEKPFSPARLLTATADVLRGA